MDNKTAFIQDNLVFLVLPIIILVAGAYFSVTRITSYVNNVSIVEEKRIEKSTKETKLKKLYDAKKRQEQAVEFKKESKSGKVIYEVLGQQFSSEASFGIMFENI